MAILFEMIEIMIFLGGQKPEEFLLTMNVNELPGGNDTLKTLT